MLEVDLKLEEIRLLNHNFKRDCLNTANDNLCQPGKNEALASLKRSIPKAVKHWILQYKI